jgi:signal transduction histidine kinase
LILTLFSLWPDFDFVTILFVPLCYQAALVLSGPDQIRWIAAILALLGVSMTYFHGIRGLALALLPMAGGFLFAAQVIINRQLLADRRQSQAMLTELQAVNQKLQAYALQVEELTTLEERHRLARELHDSVSQNLFGITLNARSAQILLERDPARVQVQLEELQSQTQAVLDDMRRFITALRPKEV